MLGKGVELETQIKRVDARTRQLKLQFTHHPYGRAETGRSVVSAGIGGPRVPIEAASSKRIR
jgi:hypothetical protein